MYQEVGSLSPDSGPRLGGCQVPQGTDPPASTREAGLVTVLFTAPFTLRSVGSLGVSPPPSTPAQTGWSLIFFLLLFGKTGRVPPPSTMIMALTWRFPANSQQPTFRGAGPRRGRGSERAAGAGRGGVGGGTWAGRGGA